MKAIVSLEEATPIAFLDVYEKGDYWVKVQGCEKCSLTRRKRCCGKCPMQTHDGKCSWQVGDGRSSKPFFCVIWPTPDQCKVGCAIVYKCEDGLHKGKFRHVNDRRDIFRCRLVHQTSLVG